MVPRGGSQDHHPPCACSDGTSRAHRRESTSCIVGRYCLLKVSLCQAKVREQSVSIGVRYRSLVTSRFRLKISKPAVRAPNFSKARIHTFEQSVRDHLDSPSLIRCLPHED